MIFQLLLLLRQRCFRLRSLVRQFCQPLAATVQVGDFADQSFQSCLLCLQLAPLRVPLPLVRQSGFRRRQFPVRRLQGLARFGQLALAVLPPRGPFLTVFLRAAHCRCFTRPFRLLPLRFHLSLAALQPLFRLRRRIAGRQLALQLLGLEQFLLLVLQLLRQPVLLTFQRRCAGFVTGQQLFQPDEDAGDIIGRAG